MLQHDTFVRVRYGETDQMGYVYYGKYAEYFEVGRVELIRNVLGLSYKAIEENGYFLPVANLNVKYLRPGRYDDLLRVRTRVPEMPRSSFLTEYEIFNEADELLVTGMVKLAFFHRERLIPVRIPAFIKEAVERQWKKE
ncbi:MAG: thioesterase family protein [Bacteroidota bacterium]